LLGGLGFSAPRIRRRIGRGLLLLEDLGDSTYTTCCSGGATTRSMARN
jgi:aminoglycoside/choline kinase family phosphotransferase